MPLRVGVETIGWGGVPSSVMSPERGCGCVSLQVGSFEGSPVARVVGGVSMGHAVTGLPRGDLGLWLLVVGWGKGSKVVSWTRHPSGPLPMACRLGLGTRALVACRSSGKVTGEGSRRRCWWAVSAGGGVSGWRVLKWRCDEAGLLCGCP